MPLKECKAEYAGGFGARKGKEEMIQLDYSCKNKMKIIH